MHGLKPDGRALHVLTAAQRPKQLPCFPGPRSTGGFSSHVMEGRSPSSTSRPATSMALTRTMRPGPTGAGCGRRGSRSADSRGRAEPSSQDRPLRTSIHHGMPL